jgi:DNA-binding SARP family transcriptional activator/Tfp pilus assembly protein PilF
MDVRLLGPVEVRDNDVPIKLGRRRERCLLGVLMLEAGTVVPLDRIVNLLWQDDPPAGAVRDVHTTVARLRASLAPHGIRITTVGTGYLADVPGDTVDAHRFTTAVARAQRLPDPADRVALLDSALALWRGPLLADVADDELRGRIGAGLDELRLFAVELRAQAQLDAGRYQDAAAGLAVTVERYPTRERLVELLMAALYRSGRRVDALAAYRRTRDLLVRELGVEPGARLRQVHLGVLTNDPALAGTGTAPARWRFLPRDVPDFTGRVADLDQLDAITGDSQGATAVVVTTVAGAAGVGKTAFAVHWGHRAADRFPDGQLHVNLRGYDVGPPLRAIDALAQLLRAMGLTGDKIPIDEPEAAGLYRSVLADKRVLVLLDNARSVDQVRPLLPSGPGSVALITSRDRLAGLLARDGATRITLDVLDADEAVALLTRILGAARISAEPAAARDLAEVCGYLPLALRIAAANLADQAGVPIADRVAELRAGSRIAALMVEGDPASALRSAFDQSYATLDPAAARLFRLLGLHPGPDVTPPAAAVLAGTPAAATTAALHRLVAAHMVDEPAEGRYTLHDLVRLYARERAGDEDGTDSCRAVLDRLCRWYLGLADAAARHLYPHMLRLPVPPAGDTASDRPAGGVAFDRPAALAWLDAERANLVACARYAAEHRLGAVAWLLPDTLRGYFYLRRNVVDWLATGRAARDAAHAAGDLRSEAAAWHSIALAYAAQGRYAEGLAHHTRAMDLAVRAGWREGEAAVLGNEGVIRLSRGDLDLAADRFARALDIYRELDSVAGQGVNLSNLGVVYAAQGHLQRALEHYTQALALHRQSGARASEALALNNIGDMYRNMGRYPLAVEHFTASLEIHREVGGLTGQALALGNLAAAYRDTGRLGEALTQATAALDVVRETGDLHAEAYTLNRLATVHCALSRYDEAVERHSEALTLAERTGSRGLEAEACLGLATAYLRLGESGTAQRHATRALTLCRQHGFRLFEGQTLLVLAEIGQHRDRTAAAVRYAREALDILAAAGQRIGKAAALGVLAQTVQEPEAKGYADQARKIREEIGVPG